MGFLSPHEALPVKTVFLFKMVLGGAIYHTVFYPWLMLTYADAVHIGCLLL